MLALAIVESLGWIASGALLIVLAVVFIRGFRVDLHHHFDDEDD